MTMDLRTKPKTSDGRPIFLTSRFRGDVDPYFAGIADTVSGRALGDLFLIHWATAPESADDKNLEWSFCDWIYIAKGTVRWKNAGPGDYLAFKVTAPATTVAANAGSGNCNLVDTGLGFNAIVPASGDGSHDFSDPVPVPTFIDGVEAGNWFWDEPDEGKGNCAWVGDGNQTYNLYDANIPLVRWVGKLPIIGDGVTHLHPETKSRKVLPHWMLRVDVHNEALGQLQVVWHLDCARKKTT